jgi:molybdenum cofactor guanylyltransferase
VDGVSAFILAGGKSSRMGKDKAFLTLQGKTLLDRALQAAAAVVNDEEVFIVGDRHKFSPFGRVIEDVFPERGPLGGIHAALLQSSSELNLMLAVDVPFVEAEFLKYMVSQAEQCDALATVPRAGGRWQPLCAVYRKEFATAAGNSLQKGINRVDSLFERAKTRAIEEDELSRLGFGLRMFRNLNTQDEFERAENEPAR